MLLHVADTATAKNKIGNNKLSLFFLVSKKCLTSKYKINSAFLTTSKNVFQKIKNIPLLIDYSFGFHQVALKELF